MRTYMITLMLALGLLTPFILLSDGYAFQKNEFLEKSSKYRQDCAALSESYKKNLPSVMVDVSCLDNTQKDLGLVGPDTIHAITVAAFYEKRADRRFAAMDLLEEYRCSGVSECEEFYNLLDWGIKSSHPEKHSKKLALRASLLRKRIYKKTSLLKN